MSSNLSHLGINALVEAIKERATQTPPSWRGRVQFILRISEDYAFIRLQDVWHPLRFLRQLSGKPPTRFGTKGFKKELLDDDDPVRHYVAFVFVGFCLPYPLAGLCLWLWEVAGLIRYGYWGKADMKLGWIGIDHGRQVRRDGPAVLANLIMQDLAERGELGTI